MSQSETVSEKKKKGKKNPFFLIISWVFLAIPCMEEEKPRKRRPIDLDWETLLPSQDGDPPAVLIVKSNNNSNTTDTLRGSSMAADYQHSNTEYAELRDHELDDRIKRLKLNVEQMCPKLPDKGEKFRLSLKRMEEERERRKLKRVETVCLEVGFLPFGVVGSFWA